MLSGVQAAVSVVGRGVEREGERGKQGGKKSSPAQRLAYIYINPPYIFGPFVSLLLKVVIATALCAREPHVFLTTGKRELVSTGIANVQGFQRGQCPEQRMCHCSHTDA